MLAVLQLQNSTHHYEKAMFNPSHPGDLIRENLEGLRAEIGQPLLLADVAERLGTTPGTLAAILDRHQPVTPAMAPRLAALFPNSTAAFWLTVQERHDEKGRK
jgi:addiction module HigA family antidote